MKERLCAGNCINLVLNVCVLLNHDIDFDEDDFKAKFEREIRDYVEGLIVCKK